MNDPARPALRRWFLAGLLLALAFNFAIRWHLRQMPLERDEGEYAYAGQLLLQGIPPYKLAFNMKFPGVYFMYALLMAIFGQSTAGIHFGIFVITSITAVLIFFIGRELLTESGGLMAAVIYVCLAALPKAAGLAGHATHFVALFVCGGVYALLLARTRNSPGWWIASGTAFGLAILMVQQAVFFPVFILVWLLWNGLQNRRQTSALSICFYCAGCVVPLLVTAIVFASIGLWNDFFIWTFQYAREYVSILPMRAAPQQFGAGFDPVFESGIVAWIFGVAGLFCLWRQREGRGQPQDAARSLPEGRSSSKSGIRWTNVASLMFLAGMAAVCPGYYFRNHYFLMVMPGLALLDAAFIITVANAVKGSVAANWSKWLPLGLVVFVVGNLVINNAGMWFGKTPGQLSRELYAANPFSEAVPIAAYLKEHTTPSDTIAVLGSEPEIFFLADRHSASGFIYVYALTEPQPLAPQMGREFISQIETSQPKYVVSVNMPLSWFSVIMPESLRYAAAIQDWWAGYSTNYDLVGAVKSSATGILQIDWAEPSMNASITTNEDLLIYRRK
ncbi:MAG TPA: glycosyltransferase family 39 protein [Verrucomicrobiae bacterium]|nr:glycosyltransferase family 39 protein [Verrucomicrobiae bacterium]